MKPPDDRSPATEPQDAELLRLAEAITDETPVDWDAAAAAQADLSATVERLRAIQRLATAYRQPWEASSPAGGGTGTAGAGAPAPQQVLFTWGPLRVLQKLGEGSFGEVYRAYDATLQREVALKLRRTNLGPGEASARRVLDEARRLARVRHPNVLVVYGADVHDSRVGLWTDLVAGKTLEDWLDEHGPMGAREAAGIGLDLCHALAAVHAAGLVHGDIKAQNVMRERGGRIILMDFGSVSDAPSPTSTTSAAGAGLGAITVGTPLTMAPEVLAGDAPTPQADLYALGTLLYRLVSGRYPIEATTQDELRARHQQRAATPLRDLRPDLPATFVQAVQRALAPDPRERHASAGAMEAALAAIPTMTDATTAAPPTGAARRPARLAPPAHRRWSWAVPLAAVVVVAVALPLWMRQTQRTAPPGTAATPDAPERAAGASAVNPEAAGATTAVSAPAVDATMFRVRDGARETLLAGSWIQPGDHLYLELQVSEPLHVYVINEDEHGEMFVLFPVPGVEPGNPIAGGGPQRLPGARAGVPQDWQVSSAGGKESFLMVASRQPVELLEQELRKHRVADPERPVVYATLNVAALRNTRGVGTLAAASPEEQLAAASQIEQLVRLLNGVQKADQPLWMRVLELNNPG